jgi:hypothetical protein
MKENENLEKSSILFEFFSFYPTHWYNTCLIWIFLPILIYLPSIFLSVYSQTSLPSPLPLNSDLTKFSENRARIHYQNITYPNKVIGSFGNLLTRNFIIQQLFIYKNSKKENFRIEIETQQFQEKGYFNLMNILCRVSDSRKNQNDSSILLSTHYDAVYPSYGASVSFNF